VMSAPPLPPLPQRANPHWLARIVDRNDASHHLKCPICAHGFSHIRGVYTKDGDGLAILIECENGGHLWEVIFCQHKGEIFLNSKSNPDLPKIFGIALEHLQQAKQKAPLAAGLRVQLKGCSDDTKWA
jgi:hypothetical protein